MWLHMKSARSAGRKERPCNAISSGIRYKALDGWVEQQGEKEGKRQRAPLFRLWFSNYVSFNHTPLRCTSLTNCLDGGGPSAKRFGGIRSRPLAEVIGKNSFCRFLIRFYPLRNSWIGALVFYPLYQVTAEGHVSRATAQKREWPYAPRVTAGRK
jgi:hypothetical protein